VNSRVIAVLDVGAPEPPPGVDAGALRRAMLEDTYELAADLAHVDVVLAGDVGDLPLLDEVAWPGTALLPLMGRTGPSRLLEVLAAAAERGYGEAVVLAGTAPDLPGLLVGKLFRALARADVAVCPADGGGLVAYGATLPLADWASAAGIDLDEDDAVETLRGVAPARAAFAVAPGWHRVRLAADIARLDPGLEGWASTRALLAGHPLP
jgi:hypothetical protein